MQPRPKEQEKRVEQNHPQEALLFRSQARVYTYASPPFHSLRFHHNRKRLLTKQTDRLKCITCYPHFDRLITGAFIETQPRTRLVLFPTWHNRRMRIRPDLRDIALQHWLKFFSNHRSSRRTIEPNFPSSLRKLFTMPE